MYMSAIRTNAAAAMLGVSPNTLRGWERRFGYPMPHRTEGGHRQFELTEIEALRQAFAETHDIASAVSVARERGEGPSSPARLRAALEAFAPDAADRLLEESLAVRSVERTVESVLAGGAWRRSGRSSAERRVRAALYHRLAGRRHARGAAGLARGGRADLRRLASRRPRRAVRTGAGAVPAPRRSARADPPGRAGRPDGWAPRCARCARARSCLPDRALSAEVLGRLVYASRQAEPGVDVFDYRCGPTRDGGLDRQAHRSRPDRRGRAAARATHRRGAGDTPRSPFPERHAP